MSLFVLKIATSLLALATLPLYALGGFALFVRIVTESGCRLSPLVLGDLVDEDKVRAMGRVSD